jgi:hypothetical protein
MVEHWGVILIQTQYSNMSGANQVLTGFIFLPHTTSSLFDKKSIFLI